MSEPERRQKVWRKEIWKAFQLVSSENAGASPLHLGIGALRSPLCLSRATCVQCNENVILLVKHLQGAANVANFRQSSFGLEIRLIDKV